MYQSEIEDMLKQRDKQMQELDTKFELARVLDFLLVIYILFISI